VRSPRSLLLVAAAALAAGCAGQAARVGQRPALRIAAASDLRFAMPDLLEAYRRLQPDARVRVSYGSSGTLFAQLENRAPFDLYLSADVAYPRRLAARGLVAPGGLFSYAVGRIVLWTRSDSPLQVRRRGMRSLLEPSLRTLAIANPEHAPYGRAAVAALRSYGLYERLRDRLVLGENIAQTAQFAQTGAADAGIIALSLARAAGGRFYTIPKHRYPQILQGGAILRWAEDPAAARAFVRLLTSPSGREILARYGFEQPR
jgi:molybdate transport system substrate-binding protein